MEYKLLTYEDLIKDEKQFQEYITLYITNTVDNWKWIPGYQDEFRSLYEVFLKTYPDFEKHNNPIDDYVFISSLAICDEYVENEQIQYLLGYNQHILNEFAIICKIKNEYKYSFEPQIEEIESYYLNDNTPTESTIISTIKHIVELSKHKEICIYADVFLKHVYELDLLKKLRFKEIDFNSKDYEQIHKDYKINLNKFKRFKLIVNQEDLNNGLFDFKNSNRK